MKKITIIDYGMGNIQSLSNAINHLGFKAELFSENNELNSNISILPGVGAFNHAMKLIEGKKIKEKIIKYLKNDNNFLIGICLGMQLLFTESEENKFTKGLEIIDGKIKKLDGKIKKLNKKNKAVLPNVGWYETTIKSNNNFNYIKKFSGEKFYYIHSYQAIPAKNINQIGNATYNDVEFCAIIAEKKNVIGTQFHPEKSSKIGLDFLESIFKNSIT